MKDDFNYDMPWRPNFEGYALLGWATAAAATVAVQAYTSLPVQPFYWALGLQAVFATRRLPGAWKMYKNHKSITAQPAKLLPISKLYAEIHAENRRKKGESKIHLGVGYEWGQAEGQMMYEVMKRDVASLMPPVPPGFMGAPWIHGLSSKSDAAIEMPSAQASLHTFVLGTTGAGKTRFFDLMIAQAIFRGEPVIIIDPKGDKELADNARRACELMGEPDRFRYFHPAFPEKSVSISPTANYTRLTEIASRIAALVPSSSGGDPFRSFAQMAVNNICQALHISGEPITLVNIRRYIEGGPAPLVVSAVSAYGRSVLNEYDTRVRPYLQRASHDEAKAKGMSSFYRAELQEEFANPDLEGILSMFEHDRAHFGKMIASLLPILNMLTSGDMASLLSPALFDDEVEMRDVCNVSQIIEEKKVLYMGLDSLSDQMVGQAIGSIFLADVAAVLGQRYNKGLSTPVNIFVDECAEVINDQLIQVLNKGRGAGAKMAIAAQTVADFEARMGSAAKARQVLGNTNHTIVLRVTDPETQEFATKKIPMTRYKYVMRTQGSNSGGETPSAIGGNIGERLMEEEGELFPTQMLGSLPNLEYIGILSGGRIVKGRIPVLVGDATDDAKEPKKEPEFVVDNERIPVEPLLQSQTPMIAQLRSFQIEEQSQQMGSVNVPGGKNEDAA